ncbi:MAG: sucrose-6-phosphate hydrolase [Erysipelotrichaceae bacterium]|nr:sucrose-6-phosphate hydrolase [Erysipelotrichaceae bacterium]
MKKYHQYDDIPLKLRTSLEEKVAQSPYRQYFHIEGDMGYINDPNGVCYFDGKYHLFYQWSPLTYSENSWFQGWYHVTSTDMISWEDAEVRIETNSPYETHGAYSGSAIEDGEVMKIFYTGNTRNEQNERIPYQIIATLDKKGELIKRFPPAIIGYPDGYTDHFRDPKIWKSKDDYYAVIGAQRKNLTGTSLLLHSQDSFSWRILGEVDIAYPCLGYMWECPNYFEIGDKGIFLFSPQGLKPEGNRYCNIYQTGYVIGNKLSKNNLQITDKQTFQEIDRGFDFYAAQVMQAQGRTILFAWMGLPEITYPTQQYAYCGCLTLPRELFLEDGKLKQRPLVEIEKYRQPLLVNVEEKTHELGFGIELSLCIRKSKHQTMIDFAANMENTAHTRLICDFEKRELILDRHLAGERVAEEYGTKRVIAEDFGDEVNLRVFLDRSSIEVFVNDGDFVASSRIFPTDYQKYLHFYQREDNIDMKVWRLEIGE